jgi:hypothetical protein
MLWLKGWLETRFRIFIPLFMVAWLLYALHSASMPKRGVTAIFQYSGPVIVLMFSAILAGAGIMTQSPFRATKGLHGSMMFTVSLPVTRLRMVAVRAAMGWLEAACLTGLLCWCAWRLSGVLREIATPMEMLEQAGVLIVCGSAVYFLSVVLATFLEDQWRIWGTMIAVGLMFWLSMKFSLPAAVDLIKAMGRGSPVVAHTMPWGAMGFAAGLSVVLFFVAVTIARMREY